MNRRVVKQVVGIDVAQKELVVAMGKMYDDWKPELGSHQTFFNHKKGFAALLSWVKKITFSEVPVRFVMEATGVYHETLAYFLQEKGYEVSIVLPNKISNYLRTLEIKTVTDKTCAEAIMRFGLERQLHVWIRPKAIFKQLRQLTRERTQLVTMRTITKNQLHAEQSEAEPYAGSLARLKKQVIFFDKQEAQILQEIELLTNTDKDVKKSMTIITSIPGIGTLTAAVILAETNGFELVRNKRQLTSYAGLDVQEKQSGTSVHGKSRISKRGNKYLRKAMHLPALVSIRHDQAFKNIYERLVGRHGIKMKAVVAIQRKLLELTYILFKNNVTYNKAYMVEKELEQVLINRAAQFEPL